MEDSGRNISWGDVLRKLLNTLKSMRFSLILLALILAACVIGSVITQGGTQAYYQEQYGTVGASVISALQFDRIFSCAWFIILSGLLCLNLLLCSILRFPLILRRWKTAFNAGKRQQSGDFSFELELPEGYSPEALGMSRQNGVWYKAANRAGIWGSWICHLGMLLVITGFALGRMLSQEWTVYGIPGSEQPLGDSGYTIAIDDFNVELRDDFTVEQYTAALTLTAPSGEQESGEASVNHPLSAFGMSFYQDSTGWAGYLDITYDEDLLRQDLLCVGEYTYPDQLPSLIYYFNRFYPDLTETEEGYTNATPLLNNPYALYTIYYQNQVLDMGLKEVGETVTLDHFGFTLHDPVMYTLIVAKKDPTAAFVGAASLVMILGIVLAFYVRPYEIWTEDGKNLKVKCEKAPELLQQSLRAKIEKGV